MISPLPLAQWLDSSRPDAAPVAWLGERTWTLGELRQDVTRAVLHLQSRDEQRWALCFDNSYLFVVALLAALHAGKTPVLPGHSRPALLNEQRDLFDGVLSASALGWNGPELIVSSAGEPIEPGTALPPVAANSVIELFTSGSTGTPKRVVKPVALLDTEIAMLAERFGQQIAGCRVVSSVVPQHMYGLTYRIFLPMSCGLPLHAQMTWYAEQLSALDPACRYVFVSSPAFLKRLDAALAPPSVAVLFSAGGALARNDVQLVQRWLGIWPDEIYGSTETGSIAWRRQVDNHASWQLFPGITLRAESDNWHLLSPLLPSDESLPLDDNIELVDDGFRLTGRRGRVIKIEDKRVSLSEIEQRLMALDGVTDAAAVALSRHGRQGIGAVLTLNPQARQQWLGASEGARDLAWRRALQPWLDPLAVPRYWRVIDEIPVNSMNKRLYAQLEALFHEAS
ncbi:acyl-CoA synthetase [Pluralibacter gergoviae]